MRASLRAEVRALYGFRCGYCGVREQDAGAELTVDHYRPRARGGNDSPDNLVYCCHACNEFKRDHWDPEGEERILHPLRDRAEEHLRLLPDDTLEGLTPTGRAHIRRLNLNRPELLAHRRERRRNQELAALVQQLTASTEDAAPRVERLQRRLKRARGSG